ncbi:MAG: hypothetical protein WC027_03575 [Candidatus Paceibacterota bacterium]
MKMTTTVVTKVTGSFRSLLRRAITGSLIEIGSFKMMAEMAATKHGLFFRGNNDEFFLLQRNGKVRSLGRHHCDNWKVGPQGLIVLVRNTLDFYSVNSAGREKFLGRHGFAAWQVSLRGLIIKSDDIYWLVKADEKIVELPDYKDRDWERDYSFRRLTEEQVWEERGHPGSLTLHCQLKGAKPVTLGPYWELDDTDIVLGADGVYLYNSTKLYLAVIKP